MSVSLRQIAKEIGLSPASVSLALRGKGRISEATRAKIREAAGRLDYFAHPLVSKAFSLMRQPSAAKYRETLAFIIEYPTETGPLYQQQMYEAGQQTARSMGYLLEPFIVSGRRSDQKRASRILHARGIRGLIIIPRLLHKQPRLYFDWDKFAAVEIGRSLWLPRNLYHVETGDYHKIIEATHLLKKAGYRRIAMAVEADQVKQQRGSYNAAYLVTQLRLARSKQIPPLSSYGDWSEETFRSWMKRYSPDVLFVHDTQKIFAWLTNMKLRVPEDISLFCLNAKEPHLSGLRRDYAGLGRSAVQMLSLQLDHNELGLHLNPPCWQVDEFWQDGETLSRPIAHLLPQPSPPARQKIAANVQPFSSDNSLSTVQL